jgi:hypothetical protein
MGALWLKFHGIGLHNVYNWDYSLRNRWWCSCCVTQRDLKFGGKKNSKKYFMCYFIFLSWSVANCNADLMHGHVIACSKLLLIYHPK